MASRRGIALDGVLLLDKPVGLSSNHALQRARRILNANKAGHTGTLDPFATGLMILCFGEATKYSARMFEADKSYIAEIAFGVQTDTGDHTGLPVHTTPVTFTESDLLSTMVQFLGDIDQIPPMYSALKRDGKPLYEYARAGIELDRPPRRVHIHEIKLLSFQGTKATIYVSCSKGTYIRTLAQDIGLALQSAAHLTQLQRTQTAGFSLDQAVSLEQLEQLDPPSAALLPIESLVAELPVVSITGSDLQRFMQGQTLPSQIPEGVRVRVHTQHDGKFMGTASIQDARLTPERLISQKEIT